MNTNVQPQERRVVQLGRNARWQNCPRLGPVAQDMKSRRLRVGTKTDADARSGLICEIDANLGWIVRRAEVAETNMVHSHWCAVKLRQHIRQGSAKMHNGGGVRLLGQILSDAPGLHLQVFALVTAAKRQRGDQSDQAHNDQGRDDLLFVHGSQNNSGSSGQCIGPAKEKDKH
jgi:hypothetical protein